MRPWALVVGGTIGALIRYGMATWWPLPHHVLISTTVTVGCSFLIASYLLAAGSFSATRSVVLGVCASAASMSAWAVLTISQPMKLSLEFLVGTPAAAVGGLICGLAVARAVSR